MLDTCASKLHTYFQVSLKKTISFAVTQVFPWFMKYVTGGYVGMEEAGERLAQVIDAPECAKSDVYWAWNGGAQAVGRYSEDGKPKGAGGSGGEIFENSQSDRVKDAEVARQMYDLSVEACGLTEKELPKAAMVP